MKPHPTILYINVIYGERFREMVLAGIRRYATACGWNVEALQWRDSRPNMVSALLAARRDIVGCVIEAIDDVVRLPPRVFGGIPAVYLHAVPSLYGGRIARVASDNEAIAGAAFRELSAGRPKAFALVGLRSAFAWSAERERAFRKLAKESGAPCASFPRRREKDSDRADRLAAWVARLPRQTAIFAVNDNTAAEVAEAARIAHRAIPRELTLLGVDNNTAICEASKPTISSISIDHERSGYLAAKLIGERIGTTATPKTTAARKADCPGCSSSLAIGPLLAVRRDSTRGSGRREPFILEAVEMIRREASSGLTAARLARRFPCSRSLFYLRFREAMGHSVLDEILNVKLEKVFTLLSQTDTPIGAIADFCGFRSAIALKWIFRKRTGMSMREWRARNSKK